MYDATPDEIMGNDIQPGSTFDWGEDDVDSRMHPPFNQLGICLIDCSGSMSVASPGSTAPKYTEVVSQLFTDEHSFSRLMDRSSNALGFQMGYITFNTTTYIHEWSAATDKPISQSLIDAVSRPEGGTNFTIALEKAENVAEEWLEVMLDELHAKRGRQERADEPLVVIMLMSDGGHQHGVNPLPLANKIKQRFGEMVTIGGQSRPRLKICTALYGNDVSPMAAGLANELAAEGIIDNIGLMQAIATDPEMDFSRPTTARQLRDFFMKSMTIG